MKQPWYVKKEKNQEAPGAVRQEVLENPGMKSDKVMAALDQYFDKTNLFTEHTWVLM